MGNTGKRNRVTGKSPLFISFMSILQKSGTAGTFGLLLGLGIILGLVSCGTGSGTREAPMERPVPAERPPGNAAVPQERPAPAGTADILAEIADRLGEEKFEEALALFETIKPEDAETDRIRLLKASVLVSADRIEEARSIVTALLEKEPDNADALYVLSAIELASGKDREQRLMLERIIKDDPKNVAALAGLGNIALRARSFKNAAGYFDRVLAEEAQNPDALIGRAEIYRVNRDYKQAEALLNRAISLYPKNSAARHERGRLYRATGHPALGLADVEAAEKLDPENYWILCDKGNILLGMGRRKEALTAFERAKTLDPGEFLAYVYAGGIKDETGDYPGAEADYAMIVKLRPDYYFAAEGLGVLKMRKKAWNEARDAFLSAYKQAPGEYYYALLAAICWMRGGKPADPRQFLTQALGKIQRDSLEWYLVRLYYDLSGRVFAGENDMIIRAEREKDPNMKFRAFFYLANYYDIRGLGNTAEKYYLMAKNMDQQALPEWRLNAWALEARNLD